METIRDIAHPEGARRQIPTVARWHSSWLSVNLLAEDIRSLAPRVRGKRFLDIACGNKPYHQWFQQVELYVGIDIARANSSAEVITDTLKLPFAPEVFDGALCTQAIEHVKHPGILLEEARRVLKPGGQLLLSAPMYWPHHEEPYDYYRFSRYGLRSLLEEAGFEIESWTQQGGAWRVVGQSMANALQSSIHFRTFGLTALAMASINTFFGWLDGVSYRPEDTCNFAVLARRV